MKTVAKGKIIRLVALVISLLIGGAGLISFFTYFNVDTNGQSLKFSQGGISENIEEIAPTFDGSGYFTSSYYDVDGERKSIVKKIGADGEVEFETELVNASENGETDNGVFTYVTGVSEDRVIAFTSNWYYLYELTDSGLNLLDVYQGYANIGAGVGVRNYAFDVYDGKIDIYTVDNKGANAATLTVFVEKVTIEGDQFVGSVCKELKRASGKRLTYMGAYAKGISVSEDHKNVIVAFTSSKAFMFSTDLSCLDVTTVAEYNENVKTIQIGIDGDSITSAQYDGNDALYVFTQNCGVYRITQADFENYGNDGYTQDKIATIGEYGSFSAYDAQAEMLFTVNEDGNTLYVIDTKNDQLKYQVSLKFRIKNMVACSLAETFVCQWQDNVTEKIEYVVYDYSVIQRIDFFKTGKTVSLIVGIVMLALALLFAILCIFEGVGDKFMEKATWFFKNAWASKHIYLIMLPSFALLFMFSIYPSVASMINSFFEYELGKPKIFIGFENYKELFVTNSGLFLEILRNTVLLVATYLFTQIVPPVFYAYLIMLLRNKNSVKVIRWFMYIPGLIPTIAAMLMWRYGIYGINPDGALNIIIKFFGGEPIPFLGHSDYAIWSILFIGFPWVGGFLLFYGALMTVPTEVYDALELEGCGLVKRFFVIDLPFIMGQVKYVSIGAIIAGVKSVGRIMATTDGTMGTMTLMYKLYDYLNNNQYGMASTIAVLMVLLLAGISFARVRKMLKKENAYD